LDGLKKLKMLTLTRNKITKLPSSIGQLTSLKKFAIDGNFLQNIADEIGNLCNLE
jgi:Leucine-rich repeat (LRR) protein